MGAAHNAAVAGHPAATRAGPDDGLVSWEYPEEKEPSRSVNEYPTQPRRQARGQRRIEQILTAAMAVFAESGYDGATTNAIAARAGISPGSLYQFFRNKDDIVRELAQRYGQRLAELRRHLGSAADPAVAGLEAAVDSALRPIVQFNLENPGFKALFARTDMPPGLAAAIEPMHAAVREWVAEQVARLLPDAPADQVARIATVATQLVRGMVPLITSAEGAERDALIAELRTSLVGYLSRHAARA